MSTSDGFEQAQNVAAAQAVVEAKKAEKQEKAEKPARKPKEKKKYAGIPSVEFDCTLTLLEQGIPAKLIYYQTEGRWVLVL